MPLMINLFKYLEQLAMIESYMFFFSNCCDYHLHLLSYQTKKLYVHEESTSVLPPTLIKSLLKHIKK